MCLCACVTSVWFLSRVHSLLDKRGLRIWGQFSFFFLFFFEASFHGFMLPLVCFKEVLIMCQYTTHPLHIAVYVVKTQLKSHPANYCEKKWLQKIFRPFFLTWFVKKSLFRNNEMQFSPFNENKMLISQVIPHKIMFRHRKNTQV